MGDGPNGGVRETGIAEHFEYFHEPALIWYEPASTSPRHGSGPSDAISREKCASSTLQAVETSRADLRELIEESPYAVAMLDRDMRYVFASRRWLSDYRLALSNEEIRGRSHHDVFPEAPERWRAVHRRALAGEVVKSEGDSFERADGAVDWVHWEVRLWRTDDGDVAGILIFTEDISHDKRAEDELRRWEYVFQNAAWACRWPRPTIASSWSIGLLRRCTGQKPAAGWGDRCSRCSPRSRRRCSRTSRLALT